MMTNEQIETFIDAEIQECDRYTPEELAKGGFDESDAPYFDGLRSALTQVRREMQGQTVAAVLALLDRKLIDIDAAFLCHTATIPYNACIGFLGGLRDSLANLQQWIIGDDDGETN
jgi:hypothetical protein